MKSRSDIINLLINKFKYKKYLEIGVNDNKQPGWNWIKIDCELKHGVDPNVDTTFKMTSDEFFENHITHKYDIIFIDGLHIFEQAYKDIVNSLKWLEDNGTIVVHDCNPLKEITQRRIRESDDWHGDVWKSILKLRLENNNIELYTIDIDEGCCVIRCGNQNLLNCNIDDPYNFEYLDKNRKDILNLIQFEEFENKMNYEN